MKISVLMTLLHSALDMFMLSHSFWTLSKRGLSALRAESPRFDSGITPFRPPHFVPVLFVPAFRHHSFRPLSFSSPHFSSPILLVAARILSFIRRK